MQSREAVASELVLSPEKGGGECGVCVRENERREQLEGEGVREDD